jgi:LmbE family N-acetylglucosaminyl deacetylase
MPDFIPGRQRAAAESLLVSGREPLTFLNPGETAADAFAPVALTRLRDINRRHDPHGVLRGDFPVRP